jgi:hypothetical protein
MEPEGSLPHSQEPVTYPYPDPDLASPCPPSHFCKIHFNIILPSTRGSFFQVVSFPQVSPPKSCMHLSSPSYVLHALPLSSFLILSHDDIWWEAPLNNWLERIRKVSWAGFKYYPDICLEGQRKLMNDLSWGSRFECWDLNPVPRLWSTFVLTGLHCVRFFRFFYRLTEPRGCHGMSRRKQAFCALKLPGSVQR